jgi:hypothetical protein
MDMKEVSRAIEFDYLSWVWDVPGRNDIWDIESYKKYERVYIKGDAKDWDHADIFDEKLKVRKLAEDGGIVVVLNCNPHNAKILTDFNDGIVEFTDDVVELSGNFHIMVWSDQKNPKEYRKKHGIKQARFLSPFKQLS